MGQIRLNGQKAVAAIRPFCVCISLFTILGTLILFPNSLLAQEELGESEYRIPTQIGSQMDLRAISPKTELRRNFDKFCGIIESN